MPIKPSEVSIADTGILTNAFGKVEAEAAGAIIVRYHQAKGLTDWTPVSRRQLADFIAEDDVVRGWVRNPVWRPAPWLLERWGLVDAGWAETDTPALFTAKALDAIEHRGSWKAWPRT